MTAVELSELFLQKRDAQQTRDALWKRVVEARSRVARQILDEQLGTGYSELITYFPSARTKYADAFAALADIEEQNTQEFLADAEKAILGVQTARATFQTADLGNALRAAAAVHEKNLKSRSDKALEPARAYLLEVVKSENEPLLAAARK